MHVFEEDTLLIRDRFGGMRPVYRLSYEERRRFRRFQSLAVFRIADRSLAEIDTLYDTDDVFAYCLHECLKCFGLDPDSFSFSQIIPLVLFRMVDDTRFPSMLIELEFPSSDEPTKPLDSDVDPDLYALAVVWIESGEGLEKIVKAVGSPRLSFNDIQTLSSVRAKLMAEAMEEAEKRKGKNGRGKPVDRMSKDKKDELLDICRQDIEMRKGEIEPMSEAELVALGIL